MTQIIPAILAPTFAEFESRTKKLAGLTDWAQIDVMDGEFVAGRTFSEREEINGLNLPLNWELHLMVRHPLMEMKKWAEVKNIRRVIFHIESADDPQAVINSLRGQCLQVGIALNPETPIEKILPYASLADEILFMTVYPGKQGAQFLSEIGEKIQKFTGQLISQTTNQSLIAADGGINEHNIALVKSWGVETFYVGSALTKAENPDESYQKLLKAIQ